MQLDIKVDTNQVMEALEKMQRKSLDMRKFMRAVGNVILKSTHENFEHEGRPKWKGWSPLTQKAFNGSEMDYAKSKRKTKKGQINFYNRRMEKFNQAGGIKILQRSGKLKKAIEVGPVTKNSVEVGVPMSKKEEVPYARIHQLGGVIRPKNAKHLAVPMGGGRILKLKKVSMPARPYLKLQKTDYETILRIAEDFLLRGEIG